MENTTREVTVREVIGFSIKDLSGLNIPVDLIPTIGVTISRVLSNLRTCYNAIHEPAEEEINLEPVEEVPEGAEAIPIDGGEQYAEEN